MSDWYDERERGRRGEPRAPHEVSAGYIYGQQEAHASRAPIPVSPEAGMWMLWVVGLPIMAAIGAVAAAAITGNDIATWAKAAGGVTLAGMIALTLALAALAVVVGILRALVLALPALIVTGGFAAAVLLILRAFGVGPGLTFL